MLKLMKYEFKATYQFFLGLAVIVLGLSVYTAFSVSAELDIAVLGAVPLAYKVFSRFILICAAALTAIAIYAIVRFCETMLGDEGYITHTLPLDTGAGIMAKNIIPVIWAALICGVALVIGLVLISNKYDFALSREPFDMYNPWIESYIDQISQDNIYISVFIIILTEIAQLSKELMIIYGSLSAGYSFKNHKRRKAFLCYISVRFILVIASRVYTRLKRYFLYGTDDMTIKIVDMRAYRIPGLGLSFIKVIAFTAVIFFITRYFIKNRLNLN